MCVPPAISFLLHFRECFGDREQWERERKGNNVRDGSNDLIYTWKSCVLHLSQET
jgi:hypothetical protein